MTLDRILFYGKVLSILKRLRLWTCHGNIHQQQKAYGFWVGRVMGYASKTLVFFKQARLSGILNNRLCFCCACVSLPVAACQQPVCTFHGLRLDKSAEGGQNVGKNCAAEPSWLSIPHLLHPKKTSPQ